MQRFFCRGTLSSMAATKQDVLRAISDAVMNLTYYDRRDSGQRLTLDEFTRLLTSGEVTVDDMVKHFEACLRGSA